MRVAVATLLLLAACAHGGVPLAPPVTPAAAEDCGRLGEAGLIDQSTPLALAGGLLLPAPSFVPQLCADKLLFVDPGGMASDPLADSCVVRGRLERQPEGTLAVVGHVAGETFVFPADLGMAPLALPYAVGQPVEVQGRLREMGPNYDAATVLLDDRQGLLLASIPDSVIIPIPGWCYAIRSEETRVSHGGRTAVVPARSWRELKAVDGTWAIGASAYHPIPPGFENADDALSVPAAFMAVRMR